MAVTLPQESLNLLKEPDTVKALSTTDGQGEPHVVWKDSLGVDKQGELYSLELIESSQTNSNLVRSLWFHKPVAIALRGPGGESYQIKAYPSRCLVTGPVFERYYRQVRARGGDVDLASVWYYAPESVRDNRFAIRFQEESEKHPLFLHLDRIAKP